MKIKEKIHRLKNYLSDGIWNENFDELSRMRKRFVKDLRVITLTVKTFPHKKSAFRLLR